MQPGDRECLAGTAGPAAASQWIALGDLLAVVARRFVQQSAEPISQSGLTHAQFCILAACARAPADGWNQSELAAMLAVSAAHVSGHVERLRQRGWLEGQRARYDRRLQVWRISAAGREQLAAACALVGQWERALERACGEEFRLSLAAHLERLREALRSREGHGCDPSSDETGRGGEAGSRGMAA